MKKIIKYVYEKLALVTKCHVGAYAAQSAYFFMLSLIPIILLLLTIVQYTPVTKADVMTALVAIVPEKNMQDFIVGIVNQVYNQSKTIIPITAIVAIWSAGKGVLSISNGLNQVYNTGETRNYFFLRVRASFYTVIFIILIILGLVLSVFGNEISYFVRQKFPVMTDAVSMIMELRTLVNFLAVLGFSFLIYQFLPNHKMKARNQMLGAFFSSVAWLAISFIFSMYLGIFSGFSGLYGSMTAIILVMLWLYFCMYVMLLGGLLNRVWNEEMNKDGEE